ncbi:hypothetical protein L9F63_003411, partial [Diploptera punctata]
MSHITYNTLWKDAQKTIEEASQFDSILHSAPHEKDKRAAQIRVSELYVKYITVVNKLDQCYDQIVHPQKRLVIRKLLDACIGRVLELKHELVNLDLSEFSYYDDVLSKLKLLPVEVEINVPTYYRREREEELRKRKKTMDDILRKLGFYEEEVIEEEMTEEEAIRLIQIHERARQGRLRSQFMKEIRLMKEKVKTGEVAEGKAFDGSLAALKIQKTWRGYSTRQKMKRRKLEEMLLIGMLQPSFITVQARRRAEEVKDLRRKMQAEYQTEYEQLLVSEKKLIKANRGGYMKEDICDEVRGWITDYWHQTGKFPDMPSEESGGSNLFFTRQIAESEISKTTTGTSSSRYIIFKTIKNNKEKIMKQTRNYDPGFKMQPSNFLSDLQAVNAEYDDVWRLKDESQNPWQHADVEMIRAQKMTQVELELRREVDQLLRGELEILQAALARDLASKGKKARKPSKKKGRSGKKTKKKKEKDLTPDRTLESLFEELITNGIIRKYPETQLSEFKGERSYAAHDLRKQGKDPLPSLGDIRQVILEYCILPMGSKIIHQTAPLVKSVLLAGPHGSGKDMLVHAICTEIGAVLFDLSPANIVGKYPGKSGLIMLVHLVNKVSRLLQPSVIYMDGAEKPFLKKVPKTDKTDPKRLKKDLPKIVKGINQDDQ